MQNVFVFEIQLLLSHILHYVLFRHIRAPDRGTFEANMTTDSKLTQLQEPNMRYILDLDIETTAE